MKNEDKLRLAKKKIQKTEVTHVITDRKTRAEEIDTIKNAIEGLAEALSVEVNFPDIQPLFLKLETLEQLPDSFKEVKDLSQKVVEHLSQSQTVKIDGFRDLWEMLVRQNNKVDKENKAQQKEFHEKLWDVQEYLEQLTTTLKQGQKPEDFKPVRLVVGGDGVPLRFLPDMPTSRGGGGSSSGGGTTDGLTDAQLRATPVGVDTGITQPTTPSDNQPVVGNVASGSADSGNPVKAGGKYNSTVPTLTDGQRGDLQLTTRGSLKTTLVTNDSVTVFAARNDNVDNVAESATTNNLAVLNRNTVYDGSAWDRMRGDSTDGVLVNLGSNNDTTPSASASVGTGTSHFRDPAVTNTAVAIKASAGKLHGYNLYNPNASLAYVHFYNVAAASVTVGTTTPIRSIALPSTANGTVALDADFPLGIAFGTAISVGCSTTATGGTAPSTALVVNAHYI